MLMYVHAESVESVAALMTLIVTISSVGSTAVSIETLLPRGEPRREAWSKLILHRSGTWESRMWPVDSAQKSGWLRTAQRQ